MPIFKIVIEGNPMSEVYWIKGNENCYEFMSGLKRKFRVFFMGYED